jgi:hypothetical protein
MTLLRYLLRNILRPLRSLPERSEAVMSVNFELSEIQGPKRRLSAKLEATGFPLGDAVIGRIPERRGQKRP